MKELIQQMIIIDNKINFKIKSDIFLNYYFGLFWSSINENQHILSIFSAQRFT